ncbi:MAG: hypothetical protein R2853_20165, partial [Thermomicrobiales bacterium]
MTPSRPDTCAAERLPRDRRASVRRWSRYVAPLDHLRAQRDAQARTIRQPPRPARPQLNWRFQQCRAQGLGVWSNSSRPACG